MNTIIASMKQLLEGLSFLPRGKQKEIKDILKLYLKIDRKTDRFQAKAKLGCPVGCGECCAKAIVSASVTEMQPAAAYLHQQGELDARMAAIDTADEQAKCSFYSPEILKNGGHCRIYPFRPLVCRLFGFSSRVAKHGREELMICRLIKEQRPADVAAAQAMVDAGLKPARSMDYFMGTYAVAPSKADQVMNINGAFHKAAEMVKLNVHFNQMVTGEEVNTDGQQELFVQEKVSETRS